MPNLLPQMGKLKKTIIVTFVSIIIFALLVIAFISPITKYLVEKYDFEYTGRQITLNWVYVNPFTGYINFNNLNIYENKSDSIFLAAKKLTANISIFKLFSKTIEIDGLYLENAKGLIFQNNTYFNFNDLIKKFSSDENTTVKKEPLHLNILNIEIKNAEIHYHEIITPIKYYIKNVNIESLGFKWNVDTIPIKFSFSSGIGSGDASGEISINIKNNDYQLAALVHKFNLNLVGQYVKDLSNYGSFRAILDADVKSKGNFSFAENVTNSGRLEFSDFHFGKNTKEDFLAFDKLILAVKELSPLKQKYQFDSVSLTRPLFQYEMYDYLDNIQTMFGAKGKNVKNANEQAAKFNLVIEIANYIKILSKNFLRSNYRIDKVGIYKGEIKYKDFSLNELFEVELNPLTFEADSIVKTKNRVNFNLSAGIKPFGSFSASISINPKDSSDFDLEFNIKKLSAAMFNPYLIQYTSFPLDRGTIEVKGKWNVRNGQIISDNHLTVIDPRISSRLKNNNTSWLPLKLIMYFVREQGNVVDYEVPISGNLNNPNFHLKDVISDVLTNIFIKPVRTPYRIKVKNIETEIEKSLSFKWELNKKTIDSNQEDFLEKLSDFIEKYKDAKIIVNPIQYEKKEKEYILFFEAKKLYYLNSIHLTNKIITKEDSIKIERLSLKDSLFAKYLNKQLKDFTLYTTQSKCLNLLGAALLESKFQLLNKQRSKLFLSYFKNGAIANQLKIRKGENSIPFNGFSFYKITYNGIFPNNLIIAYKKMNALNNEAPRAKFKKYRNINRNLQ